MQNFNYFLHCECPINKIKITNIITNNNVDINYENVLFLFIFNNF